jgi:cold-inducible RNA-binding protein
VAAAAAAAVAVVAVAAVVAAAAGAAGGSRAMIRGYSGGKRNREANRDLKKRQKEERLRRNRELRARGIDPDMATTEEGTAPLPEVKLEDVVIGVPSQPRREGFGPVKLFVGGLSTDTTTGDLRAAFAKFGELVDVAVINERGTNQSRGFGFVTFASSAASDAAIKEMNGVELDGRTIKVNRAEEPRFR